MRKAPRCAEDRYEELAESSTSEVGMSLPRDRRTKVSAKSPLSGNSGDRLGEIMRQLCRQKEIGLVEGNAMPDHSPMDDPLNIPDLLSKQWGPLLSKLYRVFVFQGG